MNATHILESHEANEQHHATNRSYWEVTYNILVIMSIVFSMATYLILDKDRFEKNPLLRFAIILLPLSCSAIQYLFLLYTNWKSNYEPEGTLHKALYYFFNVLLIAFAIISILSIIVLPINGWGNESDIAIYSVILPFFVVWSVDLVSTINDLTMETVHLIDTHYTMLFDLMMIITIIVNPKYSSQGYRYRQSPTPSSSRSTSSRTTKMRIVLLIIMLILAISMYAFIAWKCLTFLRNMQGKKWCN
ncbi:hypothetical protein [Encephalitozoon cuniculi GB-M1]|uniref:UPF0328 protein ECU09_2010 n=2 Tax=Encephalitozoon cuniculi TaxID=6035 RepID=Y9K1_ENCCU|nr:uncharacterized protein ECU09_2010 [Encephalitozoon cuniculi GB-M1]Q8STK1.1 RecName: Full=UPF0328 protein ECU09_2010 [Encephalitozoon cuniculi GB-M1]AGE96332.1 hypothetical protein ECU09_2010 [Encephalitozoon cuniculi]KMV65383.1 hypothetical protein M970_092050 [Encephalitozoon cuniculi EcunIII-L]CAD27174.1 hypothetical protein [Encephalitozoon cuniculi GB-M1]